MNLSEMLEPSSLAVIAPRRSLTERILARLRAYEAKEFSEALRDEQVWTLLCTYGYATQGSAGISLLGRLLTESQGDQQTPAAWLEMLPLPPRQGEANANESNSEIDLILGDVGMRLGIAGVQYQPPQDREGWVCMVEAKYHSDIASHTTYDPLRNQMARIIETALTFQSPGPGGQAMPDRVHFTLLTPQKFNLKNCAGGGARLYAYKFREYLENRQALLDDINSASVRERQAVDWRYPDDLASRARVLACHWVSYEALIGAMPESDYKLALVDFVQLQPSCLLDLSMVA